MRDVITAERLCKKYAAHTAVADISFTVASGEIFGIIGPNGAGKTTTIECIIGLRQPTSGTVRVFGHDPQQDRRSVQNLIGVQLQQSSLPDRLTVMEALELFSAFYPNTVSPDELLDQWGLTEQRKTPFATLSGGQKQRLFIALSLLHNPQVVFLDELTTGLDPQARRLTWDAIAAIRERGKTVVLVTHFMEEAERLCDRVAIIDKGQLVSLDTPANLISSLADEECVRFSADRSFDSQILAQLPNVSRVQRELNEVRVYGTGMLLAQVATQLAQHNVAPADLRNERPTLEDVFLKLTGRQLRK